MTSEKAIELLEETKLLALVFETYRADTPPAVTQAIKETFENINQALALLKPAVCEICKGSGEVLRTTWQVGEPREHRFDPCPRCKPAPTGQTLQLDSTLRLHSGQASSLQIGSGQAEAGEFVKKWRGNLKFWASENNNQTVKMWIKGLKEALAYIARLEADLKDIELELSTPETMICAQEKEPLYKWAATIVCRKIELEAELKQQYDKGFLEGTEAQEDANRKHIIEPLEAENKQLKERPEFRAYCSVCNLYCQFIENDCKIINKHIENNTKLQSENKRLKEALEIAMRFIDTSSSCSSQKTRFEIDQALQGQKGE